MGKNKKGQTYWEYLKDKKSLHQEHFVIDDIDLSSSPEIHILHGFDDFIVSYSCYDLRIKDYKEDFKIFSTEKKAISFIKSWCKRKNYKIIETLKFTSNNRSIK